jgi:hypothetical protein
MANNDDVDLECCWHPAYRFTDRSHREVAEKIRTAQTDETESAASGGMVL